MVKEYRRKPEVVQAVQFFNGDDKNTIHECLEFIGENGFYTEAGGCIISIKTLDGTMIVGNGDYIIKNVHGEFYPCRSEIFKATYELTKEGESENIKWLVEFLEQFKEKPPHVLHEQISFIQDVFIQQMEKHSSQGDNKGGGL